MRDRQSVGERWAGVFLDHDFGSVLFDGLGFRSLSETKTGLHAFAAFGFAEIGRENRMAGEIYGYGRKDRAEVGLSVSNIFGSGIRFDGGRRLDVGGYFFGFGFGRR
jgi:hypothetical protein